MKTKLSIVMLIMGAALASCTSDKEIKADLATKAKTEIGFAGLNYTVQNKIVTLSGVCPSAQLRQKVLKAVKSVAVIDSVIDNISIAPVQLTADLPVKQSVDSVLATYPRVTASVNQLQVTLSGYASREEVAKLMPAIGKLKPVAIHNQITLN